MGGFFSRFAQSGLLDLLANARHNHKYYFALGSVTTTSRRVWTLGGAHFRAEHATRLPPTMSPKRWCLWPGWPYARRSRALSLSPASPRLSPRVLVQRHRLADPRIGKILEISHVISYNRSNVIVGQKGSPKTSFLLFTPDSFTSPTRIHSSPILPF